MPPAAALAPGPSAVPLGLALFSKAVPVGSVVGAETAASGPGADVVEAGAALGELLQLIQLVGEATDLEILFISVQLVVISPLSFIFWCFFLGLFLRHMKVPRLDVELELELQAYNTAPLHPSHISDLHCTCGNTGSLTH